MVMASIQKMPPRKIAEILIAMPPYSSLWEMADTTLQISLNLENYMLLLEDDLYWRAYLNSLKIATFSTLLALLIGYPIAYAMAFYPTRRSESSMLWMMSTRMLPPAGVIVPLAPDEAVIRWVIASGEKVALMV